MGIKTWLARKGAVGSTARWAGNLYLKLKKKDPRMSINDVMKELVLIRYRDASSGSIASTFIQQIEEGGVRGLANLVTNILSYEANFSENTGSNRALFIDVILEELQKLNIPGSDIHRGMS